MSSQNSGVSQEEEPTRVLAIFAHNDDEFYSVGTLANHAQAGHNVTLVFLSRGENSTFVEEGERIDLSSEVAELLDVDIRYLDFPDSKIEFTTENAYKVAEIIKEIRPNIIITWNKFVNIGEGHPDHRQTSEIVLNAVSYARFNNSASELDPYRELINVYKYFDHENFTSKRIKLVDVTEQEDLIQEFLEIYERAYGNFPVFEEKYGYLKFMGRLANVRYAEAFEVVTQVGATKLLWSGKREKI